MKVYIFCLCILKWLPNPNNLTIITKNYSFQQLFLVSVSAPAKEEAGGGAECSAQGSGGAAHHAEQLWADGQGSAEPALPHRAASLRRIQVPSGQYILQQTINLQSLKTNSLFDLETLSWMNQCRCPPIVLTRSKILQKKCFDYDVILMIKSVFFDHVEIKSYFYYAGLLFLWLRQNINDLTALLKMVVPAALLVS